ncbi:MAG: hypothetical protein LBE02_00935 [Spirochaetaceae bacterium]|jgi:hypothetical protein|nr:hypothetical protein [Spirochaetaceae bacterium]
MPYTNYLYMICYPNPALIGSQLDAEQFARHYTVGSSRDYQGRLVFAELDPDFRNNFFDIESGMKALKPHEDGRPKSTKFIASYRILENVDFQAIRTLYLSSSAGYIMRIDPAPYEAAPSHNILRIYAEINPVRMLVLSKSNFVDFGRYFTDPGNGKGAPKLLYTQLEFDIDEFLEEFSSNPLMQSPIPGIHPSKIRDGIHEVQRIPGKAQKGLSLDCPFDRLPARMIRHGFMFASQAEHIFFPMPAMQVIERDFYKYYKTMI